ncbi:MAG: glycoside hydrolase family 140 protein [Armatimonadetes bacterium]|nr:glycoside hydrolase family 140 protein [Armatimonadota bacterium]MDW8121923.1 glycoside hydrolase family 140 protein [Armatimonadota bacterium]
MMRRRDWLKKFLFVFSGFAQSQKGGQGGKKKVTKTAPSRLQVFRQPDHPGNGRYLVTDQGQPFFYLGDTAWELFHRLTREEAEMYLKDRAEKGFTVIQAVVLAEFDGLNTPNAYGYRPLHHNDPTQPNEDYFKFVDWVIERAEALGLTVGLLPTWGDKVNKKWGVGPEIFTPDNARPYGEFLGKRYRDRSVIWILGGDRPIESETHFQIWQSMAEGLRKGDDGTHLITYHPMGGHSSSNWFHDEPWLDFNMIQSGHHARHIENYELIQRDYNRSPVKPCMDGEPRYEDHPINWDPEKNGWFSDYDVRQAAYWALLAGAHGHTYGCHDIWQFYDPPKTPPISHARTPWKEALKLPGAGQMQFVKRLLLSRPVLLRVPDQSLLASDPGHGPHHIRAARAVDGSYAFLYLPTPRLVTVRLNLLSGKEIRAWWYDPRKGTASLIGEFRREGDRTFHPEGEGETDWVLVLDNSEKDFPAPGSVNF